MNRHSAVNGRRVFLKEHHNKIVMVLLFVTGIWVFLFSLTVGHERIYFSEVVECLVGYIGYQLFNTPKTIHFFLERTIIDSHLPRVLAGLLIGAALSAAGAVYQGIFRNPKISPDFLGATTGAGFGAAVAITLGWTSLGIMANAFVFGLIAVTLAYAVSLRSRANPALTLLLAGIMVSALFDSALTYIEATVDRYSTLPDITFWLMGSLVGIRFSMLTYAAPFILAGFVVLFFLRWPVNLLTMGEDESKSMGVDTGVVRVLAILAATLMTAAGVAVCGKIGWIGLVIPHFARMLVGYDYRILLPASMLMGGVFLMLVDILARYWGKELPLGMLTAFIGVPFFLYLLLGRRYRM